MYASVRSGSKSVERVLLAIDDVSLLGREDRLSHLGLLNQLLVEVGEVVRDLGLVGGNQLLLFELFEVEVLEPGVREDLFDAVGSESLSAVLVEELHNEVLGFVGHVDLVADGVGEVHGALLNEEVHSVLVTMEEGRNTDDHLVNQDSEGPPIDGVVMTVANEHLRGEILGSSTEGVGEFSVLDELG